MSSLKRLQLEEFSSSKDNLNPPEQLEQEPDSLGLLESSDSATNDILAQLNRDHQSYDLILEKYGQETLYSTTPPDHHLHTDAEDTQHNNAAAFDSAKIRYGGPYSRYLHINRLTSEESPGKALISISSNQLSHIIAELLSLRAATATTSPEAEAEIAARSAKITSEAATESDLQHRIIETLSRISESFAEMNHDFEKSIIQNKKHTIALVKAISHKVINKIYKYLPINIIDDFIEEEIATAGPGPSPLTIEINSQMLDDFVRVAGPGLTAVKGLQIVGSHKIAPGDCKIIWKKGYTLKDKRLILEELDAILQHYIEPWTATQSTDQSDDS